MTSETTSVTTQAKPNASPKAGGHNRAVTEKFVHHPSPCREGRIISADGDRGERADACGRPVAESRIEIELAGGHPMRISGSYDPEALARLIRDLTV